MKRRRPVGIADETRTLRASIHGLGAVWLNSIKRNTRSDLVGKHPPNSTTNTWQMIQDDLLVELQFAKLDEGQDLNQANLDGTKLVSIRVMRQSLIEKSHDDPGGLSWASLQSEITQVDSFESGLKVEDVETLRSMQLQLEVCRRDTANHRLFPSLLRQINKSPQRLFTLAYIERQYAKFHSYFEGNKQPGGGQFDSSRHRYVFPVEFNTETFSFKSETQVTSYVPLPFDGDGPGYGRTDIYMKKFTGNGEPRVRSSRHSTVHYHLIERDDKATSCKVGEKEPIAKNSIFSRPVHFHRSEGVRLSGHLTGLGALLLNVGDIHYKSFNLFRGRLNISQNPSNLDDFRQVEVDEWRVEERHSGWTIHLFFESEQVDGPARGDVSKLVRVEIRDPNEPPGDKVNLVFQYDIVKFEFELSSRDYDNAFSLPIAICAGEEPKNNQSDTDTDEYQFGDDDYYQEAPSKDLTDPKSDHLDQKISQRQGEHLEEGYLDENHAIPDFLEFIDNQAAYEISSRLQLSSDNTKSVWLKEVVDLSEEIATLHVYKSAEDLSSNQPLERYFINYNSEFVFHITTTSCQYQEDVGSQWLRLFSKKLLYNVIPGGSSGDLRAMTQQPVVIESNKLPLYGVGALWQRSSESVYTKFVGSRKNDSNPEMVWSDQDKSGLRISYNFLLHPEENDVSSPSHQNKLHLDSIHFSGDQHDSESSFKPVKVKILSIEARESRKLYVPDICTDALMEIMEAKQTDLAGLNSQPPSFADLIGEKDVYSATYTISHLVKSQDSTGQDARQMFVRESYDLRANRGKIVVSRGEHEPEAQVYIDGQAREMFAYSEDLNRCKQITQLRTLVDLGPSFESENDNFELDKMYGLAALWTKLGQREASLKTQQDYDMSGHKYTKRIYKIQVDAPKQKDQPVQEVQMTFKRSRDPSRHLGWRPEDVKQRARDAMTLKSISIRPVSFRASSEGHLMDYTSTITVLGLSANLNEEWKLPEACHELFSSSAKRPATLMIEDAKHDDDDDDSNKEEQSQLPKLSHLLSSVEQLHVKSEVSIKHLRYGDPVKFYVLDEWTHNGNLRVKLTSLGAESKGEDFDFIMYPSTDEVFDVTSPYKCRDELPNAGLDSTVSSNLLQFWADNSTSINHLSQLFYGPLSLWRLAEKNLAKVELYNSIELAPRPNHSGRLDSPTNSNDLLAHLERELQRETWRVSSPTATDYGDLNPWFDLTFTRRFKVDERSGSLKEWRTLDSVLVYDSSGEDNLFEILIDVVNYNHYQHSSADIPGHFLLPEGWGCKRSLKTRLAFGAWDDFRIMSSPDVGADQLDYEATLQVFGGLSEAGRISPPIGGSYFRGTTTASDVQQVTVMAHKARIMYPNGTTVATKTVCDPSKSLLYHIDAISGHCSVSLDPRPFWVLEFPFDSNPTTNQQVYLDDELLGKLFLNTIEQDFSIVNKYSDGDQAKMITTYERQFDSLRLTETLEGPASVVRRFEVAKGETLSDGRNRWHDSISVRVLMFNSDRGELRAQLEISMHQAAQLDFGQFLGETNVLECYNEAEVDWDKQLASFTVDYSLDLEVKRLAYYEEAKILDGFYQTLIAKADLTPLQLDGKARIDFTSHDNILRLQFNVLDAPTAYVYFNEVEESTMSENRPAMVETRLASSLGDCSRWCDELACLAMSYCDTDRSCQVIRPDTIPSRLLDDQTKYLDWVSRSQKDAHCTYYYRSSKRPAMSLGRFKHLMDSEINSPQRGQGESTFAIKVGEVFVSPTRFTEQRNNFRWQHEQIPASSVDSEDDWQNELTFATLKYSTKLDVSNLEEINAQEDTNYISIAYQVSSEAECMQKCANSQCILMSLDKRSKQCMLISLGLVNQTGKIHDIDHLSILKRLIWPAGPESSVKILDFLSRFSRFPTVFEPNNYELKLTGASPMECALVCHYNAQKCLSFDYCLNPHKPSSYCYLQKTHLTLSTFDESQLMKPTNETANSSQVNCDHYSKSVLEEFNKLGDTRLVLGFNVATTGLSAEKCAIDCMDDDDCQAFEYCYDPHLHPAQSCRFVHQSDILDGVEASKLDEQDVNFKRFGKKLIRSEKCAIYVLMRVARESRSSHVYHSSGLVEFVESAEKQPHRIVASLPATVVYLLIAASLGLAIQLTYIRLTGRPLSLLTF